MVLNKSFSPCILLGITKTTKGQRTQVEPINCEAGKSDAKLSVLALNQTRTPLLDGQNEDWLSGWNPAISDSASWWVHRESRYRGVFADTPGTTAAEATWQRESSHSATVRRLLARGKTGSGEAKKCSIHQVSLGFLFTVVVLSPLHPIKWQESRL